MAMAQHAETKAQDYISTAERALKRFSFFSSSTKYEDAAEAYDKAATQYKIAKKFKESGDYYLKAADCSQKAQNDHEAATYYVNAGKAYRQVAPEEAQRAYLVAIEYHMENNRFSSAAKLYKDIAELNVEDHDLKNAIKNYDNAADCYNAENSTSTANQCLLKVAHFSAQLEDYKRAIEIYEQVAAASIDNNLLKWSVKDYYFKATLCHLCLGAKNGDIDGAETAFEKYKDNYAAFENQRECSFLQKIIDAFKEVDVEKFTDAVYEWDNISKLDDWKATILFEIKSVLKTLTNPEGEVNLR